MIKANKGTALLRWRDKASKTFTCDRCGKTKAEPCTVDHIIPVNLLLQLDLNNETLEMEENFQILCRYCQYQKGGNLDMNNSKTKELLIKIINII